MTAFLRVAFVFVTAAAPLVPIVEQLAIGRMFHSCIPCLAIAHLRSGSVPDRDRARDAFALAG